MADNPWAVVSKTPATAGGWDVAPDSPASAPPKEQPPLDSAVSTSQEQAEKTLAAKSDAVFPEPKEPGIGHLLWSLIAPIIHGGQSELGERPLPKGMEALGEAAMGAGASPVGRGVAGTIESAASKAAPGNRPVPEGFMPYEEAVKLAGEATGTPKAEVAAAGKTLKAANIVNKRAGQDIAAGGVTAQEVVEGLAKSRGAGKPMMLPDVLGANVKGEAGRIAREPGASKAIVEGEMAGRNLEAVDRLSGDIDRAFGSTGAYDARTALAEARKTAAKPLYDAAYEHAPINPDWMMPTGPIGSMMTRPSMKGGMANALKIAAEEGRDPASLGLAFNEAGDVVFTKVPSWQTLDYVKRGLDDVVEAFRDKTTGKLVLDTYGNAANHTRGQFREILTNENPKYREALESWSGPSQSMDALDYGKDALKFSPEQNAARLKAMNPNDQEFARLGLAQTLRDMANSKGPLAAEFDRIAGTKYGATATRDKLRPFFRTDVEMNRFVDAVSDEIKMARTKNTILGNSETVARQMEQGGGAVTGEDLAHMAISGTMGHPTGVLHRLATMAKRGLIKPDPELNAMIARILTDTQMRPRLSPSGQLIIDPLHTPSPAAPHLSPPP